GAGMYGSGHYYDSKGLKEFGKWTAYAGLGAMAVSLATNVFAKPEYLTRQGLYNKGKWQGKVGGIAGATAKGLVWDMVMRNTLGNLIFVMAPLQPVVEGLSLGAKQFLLSSAGSDFERAVYNNSLGNFWVTPLDAQRARELSNLNPQAKDTEASIKKYDGLRLGWNSSNTFADKLIIAGAVMAKGWSSGFWGTWLGSDLDKMAVKDESAIRRIAADKGYPDANNANIGDLISRIAGTAKVERIFRKEGSSRGASDSMFDSTFKSNLLNVDKTNVYFALALGVLSPIASSVLTNIKWGDFGVKFQAVGHAWETGVASILPKTLAGVAKEEGHSFYKAAFDRMAGGSLEEVGPEEVIGAALNLIPGATTSLGLQLQEIAQEVLTPNVNLRSFNQTDLIRMLRTDGVISGVNFSSGRNNDISLRRAKLLAQQVTGRRWGDLEGNSGADLRDLSNILQSGDEIIVDWGGRQRTITVGAVSDWTTDLGVRAQMARYTQANMDARELQGVASSNQGYSEIEREAAGRLLAQRLTMEEAGMAAGALTGQGFLTVQDDSGVKFTLEGRYILEEKMAFDAGFRQAVVNAATVGLPTNDSISNGFTYKIARGSQNAASQGLVHSLDAVSHTAVGNLLMPEATRRNLENLSDYARYLGTGDTFYMQMASLGESSLKYFNRKLAREAFLAQDGINLDNSSFARRGLLYGNYYTLGKLGLNFGKAGVVKTKIKADLKEYSGLKTALKTIEIEKQRARSQNNEDGLRKLKKQEKDIKKMYEKGKIRLSAAFDRYYEGLLSRELYGKQVGPTRTMGLAILEQAIQSSRALVDRLQRQDRNGRNIRKIQRAQDKLTDLTEAKSRLENVFEYNGKTVASLISGALNPKQVFQGRGKQAVEEYFTSRGQEVPDNIRRYKLEFVETDSLMNEATGGIVPAQNSPGEGKIYVDVFQNLYFGRDNSGRVAATPNANGEFNVGAGAHEYFHALVAYAQGQGRIMDIPDSYFDMWTGRFEDVLRKSLASLDDLDNDANLSSWFNALWGAHMANRARSGGGGAIADTDISDRAIDLAYSELYRRNQRLAGLEALGLGGRISDLEGLSGLRAEDLDLDLKEMEHNEAFTQF
ncbi:MAG: hypothetical protein WC394_04580, partial [Candidatus Omnitrophota bacterium]